MAALLPPKWLTMDAAESDKKEKRNKVSSHANDDHQVLANEMQHPTLVLLFLFFLQRWTTQTKRRACDTSAHSTPSAKVSH